MILDDRLLPRDAVRSLDGDWVFRTDPDDAGRADGWFRPGTDWTDARTLQVPGAWQELADLREYTGVAWYRRTFESPALGSDERALVRFGAADYEATVWVDGTELGTHADGYLPFGADVTDALDGDDHALVVRVEDPADLSEIPHGKQADEWYTRVSGLWQSVDLLTVPTERVTAAYATPDLDDDSVSVAVESTAPADTAVTVTVRRQGHDESAATATGSVDADGAATLEVSLTDPDYWTPADPALYEFAVEVGADTYVDTFGMRSVDVADGDLLLNGEPVEMRGALDQAYYPETLYRPHEDGVFEREIETAKAMGLNTLRKHIKPPHPEFVRRADELGVLVWAEPANPTVYTERSKREVRAQFEGLVDRDYNAPSVVAWSLYNEEWGIGLDQEDYSDHPGRLANDADKQAYLAEFVADAREYDSTRLVCDNSGWAHVDTDLNDYHEYFVVPDRAAAWRERLAAIIDDPAGNYATTDYDDPATTPLLVSEFGTWGLPDVAALRDHDGGDPHWFDHPFLEGLARPAGVDERFAATPLADQFAGLGDLATAWQRRELDSVTAVVRDLRADPAVAGYVVTELTDIEWEFNGLMDYLRTPKAGFVDALAAVNAPVSAWVEPRERTVWADGRLVADLVVVNDTGQRVELDAEWAAFGETGTVPVTADAHDVARVERAVEIAPSPVEAVRADAVTVSLPDREVTTETDVAVAPSDGPASDLTVTTDDDGLADALAARGYRVVDPAAADVAVLADPEAATGERPDATVVVPDRDGHLGEVPGLSVRELPERESWNLCASFLAQSLFDGVGDVPGWAFDGLYPYGVVDPDPSDDVSVSYAEGWVANAGAAVLTRRTDEGALTACTLRVTDAYGDHPVATAVLDRLLADAVA